MKKKNVSLPGFTLIELLVVITIIGILATIVVVNLNTTRGRGQDVAIKEQMSQIRAASELYYDGNYGYSTAQWSGGNAQTQNCLGATWTNSYFADADFIRSIQGIKRNGGTADSDIKCALGQGGTNAQSWRVTAKLRLGGYWCVDSFGNSKDLGTSAPSDVSGAVDAKCP